MLGKSVILISSKPLFCFVFIFLLEYQSHLSDLFLVSIPSSVTYLGNWGGGGHIGSRITARTKSFEDTRTLSRFCIGRGIDAQLDMSRSAQF